MVRNSNSVNIGNAGEHLIMAELLARGFHAFMADRGNPAFDIAVILPDRRQVKLRCKTCSEKRTFLYNAKKTGDIFLEHEPDDPTDFVALIAPQKGQQFTARSAEIWIIPTGLMNTHLWEMNREYFATTKRDGTPRKHQKVPWFTMKLDGNPDGSPLSGWFEKLAPWRENWKFQTESNIVSPSTSKDDMSQDLENG